MRNNIEIDSSILETRSEDLNSNEILRRFINIGLRIGKEAGVCNFWDYDTDWINFHIYSEDELDSIYQGVSIEKEMWSDGETAEYKDSISLVIHSIDALRGDMKAAILATSKIGIFSQDDFLGLEKEKAVKNSSDGGKHKPAKNKDKWIYRIGKDLPKHDKDHQIRVEAKKLIDNSNISDNDKETLIEIREMKKGYITKRFKITENRIKNGNM